MDPIPGIHHVTALASDPERNADFYHNVLGQRLVKTTVNFDDPGTYHLYFADRSGSPGTVITFFPWPRAVRGVRGNGEVATIGYRIAPDSVDYWRERLTAHNVGVGESKRRFDQEVIPFHDPDGLVLELVVDDGPPMVDPWREGPVPPEHALRGFHGVTLWVDSADETEQLLTQQMGYGRVGTQGDRTRLESVTTAPGRVVDLVERPGREPGRMGAGSVHHVAFRVPSDAVQLAYQKLLSGAGMRVTPVRDRQYFHSIYFREPAGVLFEIATDTPGFLIDEPVETLGHELKLPPWLEAHRAEIAAFLPPLTSVQEAARGD